VSLASRGLRDMDTGPERVPDPQQDAAARRQARSVHLRAAAAAIVLTGLALLLPT
jgi:hypothetical protein